MGHGDDVGRGPPRTWLHVGDKSRRRLRYRGPSPLHPCNFTFPCQDGNHRHRSCCVATHRGGLSRMRRIFPDAYFACSRIARSGGRGLVQGRCAQRRAGSHLPRPSTCAPRNRRCRVFSIMPKPAILAARPASLTCRASRPPITPSGARNLRVRFSSCSTVRPSLRGLPGSNVPPPSMPMRRRTTPLPDRSGGRFLAPCSTSATGEARCARTG